MDPMRWPPGPFFEPQLPRPIYAATGYVLEIAEAFKSSDAEELHRILEEKQQAILADSNMGLAKQAPFEQQKWWSCWQDWQKGWYSNFWGFLDG